MNQTESSRMLWVAVGVGGNTRVWATVFPPKAARKDCEVGESSSVPGRACGPLSWPPGRCRSRRGAFGSQALSRRCPRNPQPAGEGSLPLGEP